jgi:hypothetical protein
LLSVNAVLKSNDSHCFLTTAKASKQLTERKPK